MSSLLLALLLNAALLRQAPDITGTVVTDAGRPIAEAIVRLEAPDRTVAETRTASDGSFRFSPPADAGALRIGVAAPGFADAVTPVSDDRRPLRVTLRPMSFFESVNVTSSRAEAPKADPTVTVTVIQAQELLEGAAVTLDDALKMVPGFTLFRRTSSRTSNPTAQGITLRGLGGTGASRSLVLADGVPLNDAFGGWVYWDKVPQVAIERVEILRGSGSDLYGADAVGGVVQILTWHPERPSVRALAEGGGLSTGRISVFGGGRTGAWSYTAGGEWFSTDGYIPVSETQDPGIAPRGSIDTNAGSKHRSGVASIGYQAGGGWHVALSAGAFVDNRLNGTPVVINDTASRQGTLEAAGGLLGGLLSARGFGGTQGYDQTYSAVAADRTSEELNRLQRVPTRMAGAGAQWVRPLGRHALLVGAESKAVKGGTKEAQLSGGRVVARLGNGGTQRLWSAFVQDTMTVNERVTLVVGAHGDGWHTRSQTTGYDKTLGSLNPRAAAAYHVNDVVSLRASAYGGFRAPTLNELYRGFRAGNTQTNPNEMLAPEHLKGGEAGVLAARGRISARVTGFWNVLDDVITNVTVSSTPQLITKVRANADKMRTAGVEVEAEIRLPGAWSAAFSSAVTNARYKGDTSLRDNRVPQVPRYNVGLDVRYARDGWAASGQLRVTGPQFEDDLNSFTLRRATVLDLFTSRRLSRAATVFAAVENAFDNEYDVGRTPTLTTGLPRAARAGVRLELP